MAIPTPAPRYLNAYSGEFNFPNDGKYKYTDIPNKKRSIVKKIYTDNGISQLFKDENCTERGGKYMYTENYARVSLNNNHKVGGNINGQYSFFFKDGIIHSIGANSVSNDRGYPIPGTTLTYSIVGGSGIYKDVKGTIDFKVLNRQNLSQMTFNFD